MFCPSCGKELSDKAYLCPQCGIKLQGETELRKTKKVIIALLLCFFLGLCGFHRFYTGYVTSGFIQLLLSFTGVGLIITVPWVIIDFINIAQSKFPLAPGVTWE